MFLMAVLIDESACLVVQTLAIQHIKYPINLKDHISSLCAKASNVLAKCEIVNFNEI